MGNTTFTRGNADGSQSESDVFAELADTEARLTLRTAVMPSTVAMF